MSNHDFTQLFARYPDLIAQMPETFTSHDFIKALSQQNQALYIEALYSYRDSLYKGIPAPFMVTHSILAKQLVNYPELVQYTHDVPSVDLFGQAGDCAEWRKAL